MENMERTGNSFETEKDETVDYSLTLSEIHHRVRNSQNEFPEGAYSDLVYEIEEVLSENRFTNGVSGVQYSVENHYYLLGKFNSACTIMQSGSRVAFNYGVFAKGFYPKPSEQKIIDAEKEDLISELGNLKAKPKEEHYTSQETTIRNIEKMVETFDYKYEIFNISESHYKVRYEFSSSDQVQRFSLFFNWYLATLSSFEIVHFLIFHLKDSFESNIAEFSNFLKLTIADDRYEIVPKTTREVAIEEVELMMKQSESKIEDTEMNAPEETSNEKSIVINLPKFERREKNDGETNLTLNATAILIQLLLNEKAIINDPKVLANVNVRKAFRVLTGYNDQNLYLAIKEFNIEKLDVQSRAEVAKVKRMLKSMIEFVEKN
jgi:hypothetical protein